MANPRFLSYTTPKVEINNFMNFEAVIGELVPFLTREKCRFALAGAFALHVYGLSRATGDVDFIMDTACRKKVIGFLEGLGYETIYHSKGYSNHVHSLSSMGRLDFIYVEGKTADKLFSQTVDGLSIGKWSIPVPSAEHLIALKVLAMKNDPSRTFREMADIQFLMNLPGVNQEDVKRYFDQFGMIERYNEIKKIIQ